MLLLLFYLGENLYAIDTNRVVEIVPMVLLRKIQPAPDPISGVFNYRGTIVPVIDLCRLIRGTPCQVCYSSRILVVNYSPDAAGNSDEAIDSSQTDSSQTDSPQTNSSQTASENSQQRQFGLMVERVTETLKVDMNHLKTADRISNSPYLGELFVHERGMIQTINWEQLITDADQAARYAGGDRQANGAGRN